MLYQKIRLSGFVVFAAFLMSSVHLIAQEQKVGLMAYSNFSISNESVHHWHPQGIVVRKINNSLGYFSPAVILYKENSDFHEFEIARLSFNSSDATLYGLDTLSSYLPLLSDTRVDNVHIAIRYSYSFLINLGTPESKFKVHLGVGASPYFQREWLTPQTSDIFPLKSHSVGVRISAAPTLTYGITDHWFLNLNIPFTIGNAFARRSKTENPALPLSNRTIKRSDIKLFPDEYLIRLGLGLRI